MKFKVGDKVLVTGGKDKGKKSEIMALLTDKDRVVVKGVNIYAKHVKPVPAISKPGEIIRQERALPTANIAILNEKGEVDRIGYKVAQDGTKTRIFKKTGGVINYQKETKQTKKK